MAAPNTPPFPPEQKAAIVTGLTGIACNLIPDRYVPPDSKSQIASLALSIGTTVSIAGAATRLGRQKWWRNFMIDHDGDPATPPVLARNVLVVTAGAIMIAIGSTVALIVVVAT